MTTGFGRFDDLTADRSLVFPSANSTLIAYSSADIVPVLQAVSDATAQGQWAYGYVGYEAAPGLDPLLAVAPPADGDPPLAWFAVTDAPIEGRVIAPAHSDARWEPAWRAEDYDAAIENLREHIAAGDSYQVNLTSRLVSSDVTDPLALYASLINQQRGAHAAYLDIGTHAIVSASPELFFSWDGSTIVTRPMKGTTRRGRTTSEDVTLLAGLMTSDKERAEQIIVVDLLRNDLGRIAEFGSVQVKRLGVPERYGSVWQLTSDIAATARPEIGLVEIFRALFPSGSVTGAPKRRTMQLITEAEATARGVYCGAIGVVAPPGADVPRARFNVAIRTAVVHRPSGRAVYGVGGGITAGSVARAERQELQAKSSILHSTFSDFELLETMYWSPETGLRNRALHLARLADSAAYFGFTLSPIDTLDVTLAALSEVSRVRLTLSLEGIQTVSARPLSASPDRLVRLVIDTVPVDSSQRWLFHKTTRRTVYDEAAARHEGVDDVILVNESGLVTETTIASLAVCLGGAWWTPPLASGCLPGVERGRLLATGQLSLRELTVADVRNAEALATVSSLRGWRGATLVRDGSPS